MPTYLIAYEEALTQIIEKGGAQEIIDKAVDEYNTFRTAAFHAWLAQADLKCVHCGKDAVKADVAPLEEITCPDHRQKESP